MSSDLWLTDIEQYARAQICCFGNSEGTTCIGPITGYKLNSIHDLSSRNL